jgi:hypothetical protein
MVPELTRSKNIKLNEQILLQDRNARSILASDESQ